MPAMAMAIVYFGYIARMTRAGTIEVLQSDYTRTATMKGLTTSQTMRRHVLRNALIPTVAVIAVQIGYLFGGIIAVEKIFNYNGMGQTMLFAAQRKDIPMLTAGRHRHRHRVHAGDARRRPDHRLDEPAHPAGRGALMDVIVDPAPPVAPVAAPGRRPSASQARRETLARAVPPTGLHHRQPRHHRLDHHAPSSASGSRRTTRSTTSPPATCRPARST